MALSSQLELLLAGLPELSAVGRTRYRWCRAGERSRLHATSTLAGSELSANEALSEVCARIPAENQSKLR